MRILFYALFTMLIVGCSGNSVQTVATFQGQQVTGVTVSNSGRVFANFPRWRAGVENAVVEVKDGKSVAFPSESWNNWELGKPLAETTFVAVQSVVASGDKLYVLDTRNPKFKGVLGAPKVFVFDLNTNNLLKTYTFLKNAYHKDSYINDVRIDEKRQLAYFTDSGHAGIVILNLKNGNTKRVLDNHSSTKSEQDFLTIDGEKWENTVHSDGIALDLKNDMLYFHALTGYSLYRIPVEILVKKKKSEVAESVEFVTKTTAPDGMIMDADGNLYYADLEHHKIMKYDVQNNQETVFLDSSEDIQWADTFSIFNGELYYTNSAIHLAKGSIEDISFSIKKVSLK
ncbi:L-dopachrome tautomerase-related protein [Joostella sp. CR20]|uniref:L-dopachrome tautomerase-related protein n=1 Tax=Joostella sp. CR20 TaxID=2804312 RepID=UPI00313A9661